MHLSVWRRGISVIYSAGEVCIYIARQGERQERARVYYIVCARKEYKGGVFVEKPAAADASALTPVSSTQDKAKGSRLKVYVFSCVYICI